MMRPFAFVLAALLVSAGSARAQVAEDSTHLARGITGFEMAVGQISGGTGFLFSSPSTSWVIGVDRLRQETIVGTRTLHSSSPGFRLGVRKWPTSMTGPFKIFVGAGLASGDIEPNEFGSQDPALVFVPVSPSICSSVMKVSPDQVTRWLVRGNLVRLAAGVYF